MLLNIVWYHVIILQCFLNEIQPILGYYPCSVIITDKEGLSNYITLQG